MSAPKIVETNDVLHLRTPGTPSWIKARLTGQASSRRAWAKARAHLMRGRTYEAAMLYERLLLALRGIACISSVDAGYNSYAVVVEDGRAVHMHSNGHINEFCWDAWGVIVKSYALYGVTASSAAEVLDQLKTWLALSPEDKEEPSYIIDALILADVFDDIVPEQILLAIKANGQSQLEPAA